MPIPPRSRLTSWLTLGFVALLALTSSAVVLSGTVTVSSATDGSSDGSSAARPAVVPLSPKQEARRAAAAKQLYGSPEMRPMDQRKTLALAMGDSQMSGEGAKDLAAYDPNTDREGNYCHRAKHAVGVTIDLPVDLKYNIACSGAQSFQMLSTRQGGTYYYGENQGDELEVLARNTKVENIYLFIGANDPEGLNFGPRLTTCVVNRTLLRGPCWPEFSDDAQRSVGVVITNVTAALKAMRQTMTEAGYLDSDYKFIVAGYPSPINPNWDDSKPYETGCMLYPQDTYFARNKVVPMFADSIKVAAANAGVQYLDMRMAFDGHSPCSGDAWVLGMYNSSGDIFNYNDFRQSFHPMAAGHRAFGSCFKQAFASAAPVQTCSIKAGDGLPTVTEGQFPHLEIRNVDKGTCIGTDDARTADGTAVQSVPCLGSVLTSLIFDPRDSTVHLPQSFDKCWAMDQVAPGAAVTTQACTAADQQRFTFHDDGTVRPETAGDLCLDAGRSGGDGIFTAPVTVAACSGDPRQIFGSGPAVNNGGQFQFVGTTTCVEPAGALAGRVALTRSKCTPQSQVWRPTNASTESFITSTNGALCFDAANRAKQPIKVVACRNQVSLWRNNGQFSYDPQSGYIRSRINPALVLTAGARGKQLRWAREGATKFQRVTISQALLPLPGEARDDWLPPSFPR